MRCLRTRIITPFALRSFSVDASSEKNGFLSLTVSCFVLTTSQVKRALVGNVFVCSAKFVSFLATGSGGLLAEALHTLIDTVNQGFLLMGIRMARRPADALYPYGYGKGAFFYSLVSAVGMFWVGGMATMYMGIHQCFSDEHAIDFTSSHWTYSILALSFCVDGYVLRGALKDLLARKPKGVGLFKFLRQQTDPFLASIIVEDFAATTGVLIALLGMSISHWTGMVIFDGIACSFVGALLAGVSVALIQTSKEFLMGKAIQSDFSDGVAAIIGARSSVENVQLLKSQWISPTGFSISAEVDWSGRFFSESLRERYVQFLLEAKARCTPEEYERELHRALTMFGEDITRTLEREVLQIEGEIRAAYPQAQIIELVPKNKMQSIGLLVEKELFHKEKQ